MKGKLTAQNYAFAYSVGLVRTLETKLLNENEVERMMLAKDAKEAFKILNETDYADNKTGIENPADFQEVLSEGISDIKNILKKVSPSSQILNIVWLQYDFHNLKTLVKAKHTGKSYEEVKHLMSNLGGIKPKKLQSLVMDEEEVLLKIGEKEHAVAYLKKHIKKVETIWEERKDPQAIDFYLDQKLVRMMYSFTINKQSYFLSEQLRPMIRFSGTLLKAQPEITFLHRYMKKFIDLNNIRLFFRMKLQKKEYDWFFLAYFRDGNVPIGKYKDAYSKKLSEFPETMKHTQYGKLIEDGFKHFEEEGSLLYLETLIENKLTDHLKEAKQMAFGPQPLVSFFLAKLNNALVIRMIMVHKLNNVNPEEIRKRLRKLYV